MVQTVGSTVEPILRPGQLPTGFETVQRVSSIPGAFQVEYDGPGKQLRIGVAVWNPPLCGTGCSQRQVVVRDQRATLQMVDDGQTQVWLWWSEPGQWTASGLSHPQGVAYLISAEGLTADEVLQVADSLVPAPSPQSTAPPAPATLTPTAAGASTLSTPEADAKIHVYLGGSLSL